MEKHANNGLNGTKTKQNLIDASQKEALAYTKYKLYSDIAHNEMEEDISRMFSNFADNEKEHAELWLGYLNELGTTQQNLDSAIHGETFEKDTYYPELSRVAKEEGFHELSEKFRMAGTVEANHANMLTQVAKNLADGSLYTGDANTQWICLNCGYITKGNTPPDRCPLCNYPKSYFKKI